MSRALKMKTHWLALARSYEFSERLATFIGSDLEQRKRFCERVRADEGPDDAARWPRVVEEVVEESSVDTISQLVWLASIVEGGSDAILGKNLEGIIRNASTFWRVRWRRRSRRSQLKPHLQMNVEVSAERPIGKHGSTRVSLIPLRHPEYLIRGIADGAA